MSSDRTRITIAGWSHSEPRLTAVRGDPQAPRGGGEWCGFAVEGLPTGRFQLIHHAQTGLAGMPPEKVGHPMLETQAKWRRHCLAVPNDQADLGPVAPAASDADPEPR